MFSQLNVPHFGLEVSDASFVNESPKISNDHYFDESSHCIKDGVSDVSGKAYAECVKSDRDVRKEESSPVLNSNAQKEPNKNLVQAEKTEPWWRMTDKDDLASMVAQISVEHIENCDLPRPQTKDFGKRQLPSLESLAIIRLCTHL
ncbi:hypothetical protein CRYUN_Cryun13aG0089400 [Craigia yunnanensis]